MRKLLIGSAVVFLMIFTAGLATALQSASLFPFITTTGTLYFVSGTGTVTSDATATITLNQATVTTGEPTNFFSGTLTLTPVASTPLTFDIAATSDWGDTFRITGSTTSGATLSAEGTIQWPRHHGRFGRGHASPPSISLVGSILDGTTFTGRFEGVLSQSE
jgi:hypothetical protein